MKKFIGILLFCILMVPTGSELLAAEHPTAGQAFQVTGTAGTDNPEEKLSFHDRVVLLAVEKLVGWQVVGLIILAAALICFRVEIRGLLTKGGVDLELMGQKFKISQAVHEVHQEAAIVSDDVASLEERVAALEKKNGPVKNQVAFDGSLDVGNAKRIEKLREALNSERFEWRTAERLSEISGVPKLELSSVLKEAKIKFDLKERKDGRQIFRLKPK